MGLYSRCPHRYFAAHILKCEMRPSHASAKHRTSAPVLLRSVKKEKWEKGLMVKGRNEPATIPHVAHAVASIKEIDVEEVCRAWV